MPLRLCALGALAVNCLPGERLLGSPTPPLGLLPQGTPIHHSSTAESGWRSMRARTDCFRIDGRAGLAPLATGM